jgi:LuxR family maltose regulon positive regulatory protein
LLGTATTDPQSHIIERPRLLKKLDEAPGRLILLVAPAGYGKTTLARAWLKRRDAVSFEGRRAGRDIATLAIGISDACNRIVPDSGTRMQERLRATRSPEEEARILASILSEDLADWPLDAWLAIDDYHVLSDAPGSDAFIETLFDSTKMNLLLATRIRPQWITSRRLLYGEAIELDQNWLRMEIEEAHQVLQRRNPRYVATLVERSRGWPAVLGLAARVGRGRSGVNDLPSELYDYFAEELFNTLSADLRYDFQLIGLLSNVGHNTLTSLFGDRLATIIESGERVGFLMKGAERVEVHPLLATYLETQLLANPARLVLLDIAIRTLMEEELWDEAFGICTRFDLKAEIVDLIGQGTQVLLEQGRLTTLTRWVHEARSRHLSGPEVDLAEAHVALHQGRFETSELVALRLVHSASDPRLVARAYAVAGAAAHLDSRPEAFEHFSNATLNSDEPTLVLQARIGQFLSALEFNPEITPELIGEIENVEDLDPATTLRLLAHRIMFAHRTGQRGNGGLRDALKRAEAAEPLLAQVANPLARTAYFNAIGFGNCELGRYRKARTFARRLHREGTRYKLPLMMPYANFLLAASALGLRQLRRARDTCETAIAQARNLGHAYGEMNATALLARITLSGGDSSRALELTDIDLRRAPLPALGAEFVAVRALIFAATGDVKNAETTLALPEGHFLDGQIQALRECTEAILLHQNNGDLASARQLLADAIQRGQIDSFVFAYRAYPGLLHLAGEVPRLSNTLSQIIAETGDIDLASQESVPASRPALVGDELSRREREVVELLAQGLRNREIAQRLFISEVTVKSHLRRAYAKLGVSSRTEAVIALQSRPEG